MMHNAKIYLAGHRGMVGAAILKQLLDRGYSNVVTKTHKELDLTRQSSVEVFLETERPDYIILSAAKVGGIFANSNFPAEFVYNNLMIESNVIHSAYKNGVKRLLFLGSSCVYPKFAPQPIKEEYLLTGTLEPTNEPYAIAKIAGIKMCESYNRQYGTSFVTVMPTNLYGPNDNFDLETSHVIPALIRKFAEAKKSGSPSVQVWGTGQVRREFLHVDDLAEACLLVLQNDADSIVNIGTGEDISIQQLAKLIGEIVGFKGEIIWDSSKPDGTPRKLLDVSKVTALGWSPKIGLREGLSMTYAWYTQRFLSRSS